MNKILIISECYIRLVNMGKLITWRKEKNMKVEEALKYEPVLKVKEGENLKKVDVAEYDKNKGVYNGSTAKFFDGSSGNFHLMPPEDKVEEKCPKKEIEEKRNNVHNLLKLNKKQGWDLTRNGKGRNSDYHSLFDYLRVKVDNRNYDLMFFRMAINKNDKKVKCALKSIQFAVTVDEHSCDKYPMSLQDNDKKEGENYFQYYNPEVSYEEDDKIVDAFIKFIERNEENIYKSIEK